MTTRMKKIIAKILVLTMVVSLMPVGGITAGAAVTWTDAPNATNVEYSVDGNGVLALRAKGTGATINAKDLNDLVSSTITGFKVDSSNGSIVITEYNGYMGQYVFAHKNSLEKVDLRGIELDSSVVDLWALFYCSGNIAEINVNGLDTSGVGDMSDMFGGCEKLQVIYYSGDFAIPSNPVKTETMFDHDEKLVGGAGTPYDSSKVNGDMAKVDTPDTPGYFTGDNIWMTFDDGSGNIFTSDNFKEITGSGVSKKVPDPLKDCNFTAPSGKTFLKWRVGSPTSTVYADPGDDYYFYKGVRFYAVWGVPVTGITMSVPTLVLEPDESDTLSVTFSPENPDDKTVTWSSSDESVATVNSSGYVYAMDVGTATITAKSNDGGFEATCEVTVRVPVTGIEWDADCDLSIKPGEIYQIGATVWPWNATRKDVVWSAKPDGIVSLTPSIGIYDANAIVQGLAEGEATITITTVDNCKTATRKVVVSGSSVKVTGVALDCHKMELEVGDSTMLGYSVSPSGASNKNVEWIAGSEDVATVDENGLVTAVGPGTSTIKVKTKDGGYTDSCLVTVMPALDYNYVTFDANGGKFSNGSGTKKVKVASGSTVSKPSKPTRSGYTFVDWFKSLEFIDLFDFGAPVASDSTAYAQWKEAKDEPSGGGDSDDYNNAIQPTAPLENASSIEVAWTMGADGKWSAKYGGEDLANRFAHISYGGKTLWYHFNEKGEMDTGWVIVNGVWYYLNEAHDGYYGSMQVGWHQDASDGHTYLLGPDGKMLTGWQFVNGVWYFFNNAAGGAWTKVGDKWVFSGAAVLPTGAMLTNTVTPDGYRVDAEGKYIQ